MVFFSLLPYTTIFDAISALFLTCANVNLSHGKAHSVPTTSRKDAFCIYHLTEKHILYLPPHGKVHSGPTQPQDQGLRARRLPAEIGLELGGWLRQYAHEELAGQAKPIDPNGTTGPWRPTGRGPTTSMASIPPWPMPYPMAQDRP